MREGNNPHALHAPTRQVAELVAKKGIQMGNVMALGLGFHTAGDFLPHANTTGESTFGHQEGLNEDLSKSSGLSGAADETFRNPQKALSTFVRFTELWTEFKGGRARRLALADVEKVADFIYARHWKEMIPALTAGLKQSGVSQKEIDTVVKLMGDVGARRSFFLQLRQSERGQEAVASAYQIWNASVNDEFMAGRKVDINPYLKNNPYMRSDQRFEQVRAWNRMQRAQYGQYGIP